MKSLYVMRYGDLVKIGISSQAECRAQDLSREMGGAVSIAFLSEPVWFARMAESNVHWQLRSRRVVGEWFSIAVNDAIAAIRKAIDDGPRSQSRDGMVRLCFPVEPDVRDRLKILAIKEGITLQDLLETAAADLLKGSRRN